MSNYGKATLILLLAILVQSCGSSPPVRYYSLEPLGVASASPEEDVLVMGLGPLRLADYLKRSQMVTRGANNEILIDSVNRWAEPLGTAIQRTVATNVDRLLGNVAVVSFPDTDTAEIDYRLVGRVHQLDVDGAGLAVMEVQWRIETGDGDEVIAPRRDRYTTSSSRRGDPGANAAALTDLLGDFSRTVAEVAESLPLP